MVAPVLEQSQHRAVNDGLASSVTSSATFDWIIGDIVVACAYTGDTSQAHSTATAVSGGLTFTKQVETGVNARVSIWTATAASSGSSTLRVSFSLGSDFGVSAAWFVFSGSTGVGASTTSSGTTSSPSASITTTGDNSAIVAASADVSAVGSSATWLTNAGAFTTLSNDLSSPQLEIHDGHHADSGTAGTYTIGQSAPNQTYDFAALEILGDGGGGGGGGETQTIAWLGM